MHNIAVTAATSPTFTLTDLLEKPADIVFEIADHLPVGTALCLALTCKPLYALLFHRTLRRITRRERHLFLFTLTRDLVAQGRTETYYCHTCSKIFSWKCPLEQVSPPLSLPRHEHGTGRRPSLDLGMNLDRHECVRKGWFTNNIPEAEGRGMIQSVQALHTSRTGFMICCEYSDDRLHMA
ncbi:hypothetical protein CSOJ01_14212 [Colletotrichum sojae]|uniref:F-box domain-containing protein n=1 Tax=Colletotrichum sojae TaxID=2175907 RepID=A0A8H6MKE3_9PEZI|nr:hypothetical protein CSOJ01_14212 [Colletotrichum sojae]